MKKEQEKSLHVAAVFKEMAERWPSSVVARTEIEKFSGGTLSSARLSNLDCLGEGPPSIRVGRKIAYPVGTLVEWMAARSRVIKQNPERDGEV